MKKHLFIIILGIILTFILVFIVQRTGIAQPLRWKIYDELMKAEYQINRKPVSSDILLVMIGNKTLAEMQERWPYSRARFAKVIDNLKAAGAKIIAFDFIFYGNSTPEEDAVLSKAIQDADNVILGSAIDEEGRVHASSGLEPSRSGIVTKFQEKDGITRRSLTYLVSSKDQKKGFFSWGMETLKNARGVDPSTLIDSGSTVSFSNACGEEWRVPVQRDTKSFLIHFRAHTSDFQRISFCDVLNGKFNPDCVNNKIVLVGLASTMFGDIHNTPIGWLPGVTLNANAFLALYSHDFLKRVPKIIEISFVIFGVMAASLAISSLGRKKAIIFIGAEVVLFLALSLLMMICGWVWDYSLFPIAVILCPALSKKILDLNHLI